MSRNSPTIIPDEVVMNKIIILRDQKVMLDRDLAALYGTTTVRLNEQVRRNKKRFPEDFMFQLTEKEKNEIVASFDSLKSLKFSPHLPYAFTEHGAVMLASVLNSERAIQVNIQIVRIFTKLRETLLTHKDVLLKLEKIEQDLLKQNQKSEKTEGDIQLIFQTLKHLLNTHPEPRRRIGYKQQTEKTE